MRHQTTHPRPASAVTLGDAVQQHRPVIQPFQMQHRMMFFPIIDKLAVDLIREEEQVVFQHQRPQTIHFFQTVDVAGGIVGVADHDRPGARGDLCPDFGIGRQGKTVFRPAGHRHHLHPRFHRETIVIGIERFRNDHLVPLIHGSKHRKNDRLAAGGGHQNLFLADMNIMPAIIFDQPLPIFPQSPGVAVFQHFDLMIAKSVHHDFRSGNIRLPDVQVINFDPAFFSRFGKGHQFADGGWRHGFSSI